MRTRRRGRRRVWARVGRIGISPFSAKSRSPWVRAEVPVMISRRTGMHMGVVDVALAMNWSRVGVNTVGWPKAPISPPYKVSAQMRSTFGRPNCPPS